MARPLGRGLSAILEELGIEEGARHKNFSPENIELSKLFPNPHQPRRQFDPESLETLCSSIREKGLLQPILVRPKNESYEIIAGERRFRACERAGLETVSAIIIACSDEDALTLGLVENLQRENLNPLEEAESLQRLYQEFGKTQEQIARMISKSRAYVTNMMRLLTLPESVKESVRDGQLTVGHARALIKVEDAGSVVERIVKDKLNVRDVEEIVRNTKKNKLTPLLSSIEQDTSFIAQRLSEVLNLPVDIKLDRYGQGKVIIAFKSCDQLDVLIHHVTVPC